MGGDAVQLSMFKDSEKAQAFPAGSTIFSEGDAPDGTMYVVVAGEVDIYVRGAHIDTVGTGSCLGEVGLVDNRPRTATVVARSDVRLEPIDQRRFQFLVHQTPYFALEIMQIMAERLRQQREA
jgi:CRP-like cAMP-binding protein